MLWSVNQHVSHRVSFGQIIAMAEESFQINVSPTMMFEFKGKLAKEYEQAYEEIKQLMISGHLLHADETQVDVKKGLIICVCLDIRNDDFCVVYVQTKQGSRISQRIVMRF